MRLLPSQRRGMEPVVLEAAGLGRGRLLLVTVPVLREELGLTGTTRASVYVYNTAQEIEVLAASLERILRFFR